MKKIYESMLNKSLPVFLFLNLSCAIVTINVYFPAEEVKDVFQSLEDELLEGIETEGAPDDTATEPQPKSHLYPSEPTLRHNKVIATKRVFLLVPEVYAQGSLTQEILNSIKSNPVVQKAYERRNARQSAVNKILSKRLAGEGNRGMLVKRGTLSSSDNKTVNDENSDRELIIKAMAEEIVKINKMDMTAENVNSLKPQAAEQFAAVRRGEVKSGTLIQNPPPDNRWISK